MVTTCPPQSISPEVGTLRPAETARSRPQPHYTVDGGDALEGHLEDSCQLVREAVLSVFPPANIEGLLLGGGYGRGEGGMLQSAEGERPYNDLEFYIFVRGNRHLFERRYRDTLHQLRHDLAQRVGVEIEVKVLTLEALRRAAISMFFYDMLAGHKWLIGSDELFHSCKHHRAAHLLPVCEATRLLMNRCSGLLFAHQHLAATPFKADDADFIRRNISKAQLAMGDAILAAFGRYHWSCRERHERLEKFTVPIPWRSELIEHHRRGVEFKLHPFRSDESRDQLASDLNAITSFACDVWLWLESKRLHHSFISQRHYATSRLQKWPDSTALRSGLLNFKLFTQPVIHKAMRHPRERILESLALLLWEPVALSDSCLRELLQKCLRASLSDRATAVSRYRDLWSQVS